MSRYWFYLLVACSYYVMLAWSWYVLSRLPGNATRAYRLRLFGWMLLLASPSLWLTFRLDELLPATSMPVTFAFLFLLIGVFTFTVATGLGYTGFLFARMWGWRRRRSADRAAAAGQLDAATAATPTTAGKPMAAVATATSVERVAAATAPVAVATAPAPWAPPVGATAEQLDQSRRRWLQGAAYGYLGLMTLTAGGAAWTQAVGLQVNKKQIACPRLPPAFKGYRIVQIADIHSGTFMSQAHMEQVREAVAALNADMIVFTGDQVDRRPYEMAPFLTAFNGLSARDGIYGVLGNHDYIAGGRFVRENMNANGIPMLVNQGLPIRRGEQRLYLGGLDDLWHGEPDLAATFAGATPADFKICLAHNPNCWDFIAPTGVDLTLAGHTHGGQINLLSNGLSPARLLSPYVQGLFERGGTHLFVSVGVGYVGIPVRIGVPAEIVEITLV